MTEGTNLPRHIAITMDGNGRWAGARGLPRIRGHEAGVKSVRDIVTQCARMDGIDYLTLYAFSRENWKRPKAEVTFLMHLLKHFCRQELSTMMDNSVRFATIGRLEGLPADVRRELKDTAALTADNTRLTLTLAVNYGARDEIIRAVRRVARETADGRLSTRAITEERLSRYLDTAEYPDPDLIIRTAGEMRLSNFLLWQASYAELWFTKVLWPDFRREHLQEALDDFARRTRRFGGIEAQT
jgi:undecaprenyl diphosphate synthase